MIKFAHISLFSLAFLTAIFSLIRVEPALAKDPTVFAPEAQTQIGLDVGFHDDTPTRTKIDLSGRWQLSLDQEVWRTIDVPSSIDYEGWTALKRDISVDDHLLESSVFKFVALGINEECEIFINDILIGKHYGGYNSFEFDIPEGVLRADKENTIQVFSQNIPDARRTIPPSTQVWGWKNFNGILRDVYLLATPRLRIKDVRFHTLYDSQAKQGTVNLKVSVDNRDFAVDQDTVKKKGKAVSYTLTAEIFDRFSQMLVAQAIAVPILPEPGKESITDISVAVNSPKPWSPDSPDLYQVKINIVSVDGKQKVVVDQYIQNIGFTSVVLSKDAFIVNGVPLTMKGIVWHEDFPKYGASLTHEQMEKDVALIKSLGANAVRCAFHPPHPYFLSLCNRYGLFVLEELPLWNVAGDVLTDETFQATAQDQIMEMIKRDEANSCILAWGIGSNFDSADKRAESFVRVLVQAVKQTDNRPVYFGSIMLKNDACVSDVDIAGFMMTPFETKDFRSTLAEWKRAHPDKPTVLLSYGKEVDQQNHNGYSDPMSQEAQARFFMQCYTAIKDAGIAGGFIDAFADWRGSRPLLTVHQTNNYISPIGLVNEQREKRLSFDIVHALYSNERINPLPIGSNRSTLPIVHILTGFLVILFIGYLYAYNRRFGEALKRALFRLYNFYVDLRDLYSISIMHTLALSLSIAVTLALLFSSIMYHYRNDRFFDYVLTFLLTSDAVKLQIIKAVWNPFAGIIAFTILFFLFGCLFSFLVKIVAVVFRVRVSWLHIYAITVWGAAPFIFLIPLAMSIFKILQTQAYVIPSFIIILFFVVWAITRLLKGISVIYDFSATKIYIGGIIFCLFVLGGLFLYYDAVYGISAYIKFIAHIAKNIS